MPDAPSLNQEINHPITQLPDSQLSLLREALHRVWGFSDFRPLQREAMQAVLEGRDSVVVLSTGGGKSLCFQAPAVIDQLGASRRRGVALVVSPLISLMKDQVDGLRVDGVAAAYLNSTLTPAARDTVMAGLRADECRLLYVSPERLVGEGGDRLRRILRDCGVRFIAIDEAHCISQWGHDFRPDYRQLGLLRDEFPSVAIHAFTATATERVRGDIVAELRLRDPLVLVGAFDRPNLTFRVLRRADQRRQILRVLSRHEDQAGIIYCLSRREVEETADWLSGEGLKAVPYHAGLPDDVRARHQEAFLNEQVDIVVATVAFGMGIDRSNVRFVIHAGAPRSPEHYQQESGRAGRDGLPAECVLIYSNGDFLRWRQLLDASGELTETVRTLLRDMERYASSTRCRHRTLVEYFGQSFEAQSCGGACDWCLKELDQVPDSTTVARQILSCVARLKQGWGLAHVTDVLVGRSSDKISAQHHDQLSTFGLLARESPAAVRGFIEQLVAAGMLAREGEPYPVVRLTAAGVSLMKGGGACTLYREVVPPKLKGKARARTSQPLGLNPELFDVLRGVRLRLARERGVPPYVIFHDRTLQEMADRRPRTLDDLHDIYGVGARKAADFGDAFLDAIRTFRKPD